ncbi:MAG TPA: GxxExxY protein [Candidatus Thermoplasmatota archaeon]|nr:GxxExxY protein [Candidatus Thermoplasmatota archaeon]
MHPESPPASPDSANSLHALTDAILDAAHEIHQDFGEGLLEEVYRVCLVEELTSRGHRVDQNVPVEIHYRGIPMGVAFYMDLLVDGKVLVHVKSQKSLDSMHAAHVLTYLRWSGCPVGLLINFGEAKLKKGIRRLVYVPTPADPGDH